MKQYAIKAHGNIHPLSGIVANNDFLTKSEYRVSLITSDVVDEMAAHCLPIIQRAINAPNFGNKTIEDVFYQLHQGTAQMWVIFNNNKIVGVAITKINQTPRLKYCLVWLCAGEKMHKWKHLISEIEEWAASQHNCEKIVIRGRLGWEKIYQDYRKTNVVLEKKLR